MTKALLDSCVKNKVKKIIYLSTFHVYDLNESSIIDENSKLSKLNPYALSHILSEKHILDYHENKKIDGIILRLSNAFGKPIHNDLDVWSLLVIDVINQSIIKKIKLNSTGETKRDFIPISSLTGTINKILNFSDNSKSNL